MPEIQAPDLGLAIRELLGIGEANPLVTLSPEVVGVVKLADLTTTAPAGRVCGVQLGSPAAGAATYSFIWIANEGLQAIEVIDASSNVECQISLYVYNSAAYPPNYAGIGLDGNLSLPASPTGEDSSAGTIGTLIARRGAYDRWGLDPIVLPPGKMLILQAHAPNVAIAGNFVWRE